MNQKIQTQSKKRKLPRTKNSHSPRTTPTKIIWSSPVILSLTSKQSLIHQKKNSYPQKTFIHWKKNPSLTPKNATFYNNNKPPKILYIHSKTPTHSTIKKISSPPTKTLSHSFPNTSDTTENLSHSPRPPQNSAHCTPQKNLAQTRSLSHIHQLTLTHPKHLSYPLKKTVMPN